MSTDSNSPDPSQTQASTDTKQQVHGTSDVQELVSPVSPVPSVPKRVGAQRTLELEKSAHVVMSHTPVVQERSGSASKEQVRAVERTSDLQREIPRLLEQKKQEVQARKTFFVTETYDEWQDTFISTDQNVLPESLVLLSDPEFRDELERHELEIIDVSERHGNAETVPAATVDLDDTVNTRHEDMDIPDVLDIGEVKTQDEQWNDTVLLKEPPT